MKRLKKINKQTRELFIKKGTVPFFILCMAIIMLGTVVSLRSADEVMHKVARGDNLWDISKQYDVSVNAIKRVNNISKPDSLKVGQNIRIPLDMSARFNESSKEMKKDIIHTIDYGDTLWELSLLYEVPLKTIKKVNNIWNTKKLKVGQKIIIPNVSFYGSEFCITPHKEKKKDISHTIISGDSLWYISQMYNVPVEKIVRANKISRSKVLKKDQEIKVPNAQYLKPKIPIYASNKWKYIIIHHSATDIGNALCFNRAHIRRGFVSGLGYHFVIDNGTKGKKNGQIEVSPRWIKQQNGAHCKASAMNFKAIGVCLVGNFNSDKVSKDQMESLVYIVSTLKDYYNIPARRILGHGNVRKAHTECPGKRFPWKEFKRQLMLYERTKEKK
ncbi:MAG: LysM peptidoglycan-binding domain-containing protein [Candidatus Ancaeobacter aquaticus]|nr:LysM peptidoglycan-binding domain-containing protein [Candidatus Ancaeobacter aquaticus]